MARTRQDRPVATRGNGAGLAATAEPDSSVLMGQHIRYIRVSLGLTLKDIQERGGISAAHLSEIERGEVSPTVRALGRVAGALGLPPSALLQWPTPPETTVGRSEARNAHVLRWGEGTLEPLTWGTNGNSVGAYLLLLPAGREPALSHRHEGEEWLTVLSGCAEVTVEGKGYPLRAGDSLHFLAQAEHEYACREAESAMLLIACSPRLSI